ncbi:hypothetical protein QCA50_005843 [Cerrena zonata]|uniref:DUF6535 domain-containing protein n=1 Tax=Cerrena zonata TaxID=2478898 RepID=A0AAW0GM83_9APHY
MTKEWHEKQDPVEEDAISFHLRPKPKKISEDVQRVLVEPDRTGWAKISDSVRKYDEERTNDVKEDIDALLTLAGLFSAVMTTFVIDSYTRLMRDQESSTNAFLAQLIHLNTGFAIPTLPSVTPPQGPTLSTDAAVRINILWSCSLILSLVTASLGVYIKQCIHAYMSLENRSPLIQLRIRFFRDDGLANYGVWEIAALLPVLMQMSFFLFLIGFAEFIIGINPLAGWSGTGIMVVWLTFMVVTSMIPLVSSQWPYKSSLISPLLDRIRLLLWDIPELEIPSPQACGRILNYFKRIGTYVQTECSSIQRNGFLKYIHMKFNHAIAHLEERAIRTLSSSDVAILARAQNLLLDQELIDHVRRCAEAISLPDTNNYMMARLRLLPFKPEVRERETWARSNLMKSSQPTWWVRFPKGADYLLYEMLSYAFDANIRQERFLSNEKDPDSPDFWVVYESLTLLLFFSLNSQMTISSTIWRAQQSDVVRFSWLSESFPGTAVQLIQHGSRTAGVCVFLSFYSVITALKDKMQALHNKLKAEIENAKRAEEERDRKARQRDRARKAKGSEDTKADEDTKATNDTKTGEKEIVKHTNRCQDCQCITSITGASNGSDEDAKPKEIDLQDIKADSRYIVALVDIFDIVWKAVVDKADLPKYSPDGYEKICISRGDDVHPDLARTLLGRYERSKGTLRVCYTFLMLVLLASRNVLTENIALLEGPLMKIQEEVCNSNVQRWSRGDSMAILDVIRSALESIKDELEKIGRDMRSVQLTIKKIDGLKETLSQSARAAEAIPAPSGRRADERV